MGGDLKRYKVTPRTKRLRVNQGEIGEKTKRTNSHKKYEKTKIW